MIIEPKVRGFICTTAHPTGCEESVRDQIEKVKAQKPFSAGKRALIIGASTGYGLASRIALAFGSGAATVGVAFERPASGIRTATAGWYNTAAFHSFAKAEGLYAASINGDAYSQEIKRQTVECIARDLGSVDTVIYSLAAPRRTLADGTTVGSVLKTTDKPYTNKTIDLRTNEISQVTIEPATSEEVDATIKVMGGEDWADWIACLTAAGVLDKGANTLAYSYIGPKLTHPIYLNGSIGAAKRDLYYTAKALSKKYDVNARISVNKALVTQSSAAIPVVPLYISILYKTMKARGLHEGCIEQMRRLFAEKLHTYDDEGYIRMDDWEMSADVQEAVAKAWTTVSNENLSAVADIDGYWDDFYKMFGFRHSEVDYGKDVDPDVSIPDPNAE